MRVRRWCIAVNTVAKQVDNKISIVIASLVESILITDWFRVYIDRRALENSSQDLSTQPHGGHTLTATISMQFHYRVLKRLTEQGQHGLF